MPPVALSPGAYAGRIGESIPIVGRNLSSVVDRFMIIGRYMRIVFCSSTEKRDEAREGGGYEAPPILARKERAELADPGKNREDREGGGGKG